MVTNNFERHRKLKNNLSMRGFAAQMMNITGLFDAFRCDIGRSII